jgi:hypothetical protein
MYKSSNYKAAERTSKDLAGWARSSRLGKEESGRDMLKERAKYGAAASKSGPAAEWRAGYAGEEKEANNNRDMLNKDTSAARYAQEARKAAIKKRLGK